MSVLFLLGSAAIALRRYRASPLLGSAAIRILRGTAQFSYCDAVNVVFPGGEGGRAGHLGPRIGVAPAGPRHSFFVERRQRKKNRPPRLLEARHSFGMWTGCGKK